MSFLTIDRLSVENTYTRKELRSYLLDSTDTASNNSFSWILKQELAANRLHHLGRDRYSLNAEFVKNTYTYTLSKPAEKILKLIRTTFPLVAVLIWETRQYNEFLNYQIGMNLIFLEVEKDAMDAIYEMLDESTKMRILVQPKMNDFVRYQNEDTVVLIRRVSESPVLKNNPYLPSVEKLLVDLKANKYLQSIVSPTEIEDVFSQVFAHYSVSIGALKRYAMRRTAWDKVNSYLPKDACKLKQ